MDESSETERGEYELAREFRIARSEAIQAYSHWEQGLCSLFGHLAGTTDQIAGIIFFKMVNARSRIAALERLKKLKYGDARKPFFNSLMSAAQPFDTERNKIVHWNEAIDSSGYFSSTATVRVILHSPNFSDTSPDDPVIDIGALKTFSDKCLIYGHLLFMLRRDWHNPKTSPSRACRDIFERPVTYPLPKDHPLARLLEE
jgi:hypothetical protein